MNREFARVAPKFVIVHFDTRNGRAPHVDQLKVKRNCTYAIVLQSNGKELARVDKPKDLKPIIKLMKNALAHPSNSSQSGLSLE